MSYDPKGTAPGLNPNLPKDETVHMKCKKCPSMSAVIMPIGAEEAGGPANPQRLYRCVKCNFTWGMNVGGFFNY